MSAELPEDLRELVKEYQLDNLFTPKLVRALQELALLRAAENAARNVHVSNDSPHPHAAVLFDNAMFELGSALSRLDAFRKEGPDV